MNSFSHYNNYHDFELQRDAAFRDAQREHLAHLATAPQRETAPAESPRHTFSMLHLLHIVLRRFRRAVAFLFVLGVLMVGVLPSFAQDLSDPGSSEPYSPALVDYRMGYYYQLQGRHEEAIEMFSHVITDLPDWDAGYSARGDSYAAVGYYDLAIADYNTTLELTPGFVSVLYMRGRAYQSAGESALAVADFQNAISQMPDYPLPYRGLADVYYEQQHTTPALDCYQKYLALVDDTPDADVITRVALLTSTVAAGDTS